MKIGTEGGGGGGIYIVFALLQTAGLSLRESQFCRDIVETWWMLSN
jgi:hypothetical protein